MVVQSRHIADMPSGPIGPTKSLTSMLPAYGSTVALDAGNGEILSASANTVAGAGGELRFPAASTKTNATEAILRAMAGPKLMATTENSLLALHVGHSW